MTLQHKPTKRYLSRCIESVYVEVSLVEIIKKATNFFKKANISFNMKKLVFLRFVKIV